MRPTILAAAPILALVLALATPALAQTPPAPTAVVAADPADTASPQAIVAALYDVISGDAGVPRDWDRFRSLFHPAARLIPTGTSPEGLGVLRALTPEEYVRLAGPSLVRDGFHEREIASRTEQYGAIVHVFSTYESLRTLSDPAPFARGINSIQLFHDGTRWWVLSVYWQSETPDLPLPTQYLPAADRALDEVVIRQGAEAWAEAFTRGDADTVHRILADDFVGMSKDGSLYDKPTMLGWVRAGPNLTSSETTVEQVRFFGDIAIATGSDTMVGALPQSQRIKSFWTDVWIRRDGQWQVIAAQDMAGTPD